MNGYTKFRCMNVRRNISPAMRGIAALVLVCWSVALATCFHFCATRGCDRIVTAKAESSCEAHCAKKNSNQQQESESPCGDSTCFTKKPLAAEKNVARVDQPSLILAFLTAPLVLAFELPEDADATFSRQALPRDWVFTPEVSLGPAFRSLAPPALI